MSQDIKHTEIDIVLFSIFRWDDPYSSIAIALAKEFAKHNRVFFVNHPNSIKDLRHGQKVIQAGANRSFSQPGYEELQERLIIVDPPLNIPTNWMPDGRIYDFVALYNRRLISNTVEHLINKYQVNHFIYINCFNPWLTYRLPKRLKPLLTIYQSVDDITQAEYTVKHGPRLEVKAIKAADLTLVTSSELYRLQSAHSDQVYVLNNAADTSNFRRALDEDYPRPAELNNIKGKTIGYIGNLDHLRVDYHLLKRVAETHPDKTLVLIGPIQNDTYKELGLDQLPNIIFTGGKPIETLPQYLKYFDCTLIPFLRNTLTRSIYPLKINEYLSAGKAVVSTNFSEDIKGFQEHIYLAEDENDFIQLIDKAIAEDSAEKVKERLALALTNTWAARVTHFWTIIEAALSQKGINFKKEKVVNT